MQYHKLILLLVTFKLLFCVQPARAQSGGTFDLQAYIDFITSHQDLTPDQLRSMYPAATFQHEIGLDLSNVAYLDSIIQIYQLTQDELALLGEHGFVVSERLLHRSFGVAYLRIYESDLPVFVSTDAILHALHKSYDNILQDIELNVLITKLGTLLPNLHGMLPVLDSLYIDQSEMQNMINDLDIYLNVALQLLGKNIAPYHIENRATIDQLLALIAAEQPADYPLFSNTPRTIDFSQFRPRGHYTDSAVLRKYFQTMIWLGRTEMMLSQPRVQGGYVPSEADIQRQTIDSYLLLEAAKMSNTFTVWQEIDSIIQFLVGESDNVTLAHLQMLAEEIGLIQASELLNPGRLQAFQAVLAEKSYAVQRINSQILLSDPLNPEQIAPPSAFLLLGQRFVIDAYIMGNVVFDRILYQCQKVWRALPSSLDVLFALGNDAAAILLKQELNQYHYAPNLAALRYLVDSYEEEFWNSSLYNNWLQAIRCLHSPQDLSLLPDFMQTGAFWQEKMNTQLSSWAQLRHDNLLYAKPSYTGGATCSFPHSFVEPFPEFYCTLRNFAENAQNYFTTIDFANIAVKARILNYYCRMVGVMDTLSTIAEKQLHSMALDSTETMFLHNMLYTDGGCDPIFSGWYPALFYPAGNYCALPDMVVADVHTTPTDASGMMIGEVQHAGTGLLNLAVIVADRLNGSQMAYIGPVMSYYECVTMNFQRLTDDEWEVLYNKPPSFRPDWVNTYLADMDGNRRGPGPALTTAIDESFSQKEIPGDYLLYQNYPNPFNNGTVIRFEISSALTNIPAQLYVYNLKGELVQRLLNRPLPAGHYFINWDGKDDVGKEAASGIYFYRLTVGKVNEARKMSLLR